MGMTIATSPFSLHPLFLPLSSNSDTATKAELVALLGNSAFVEISLGLVYQNGTKATFSVEHESYLLVLLSTREL